MVRAKLSPPVDTARSHQMSLVRSKDTAPEMVVRKAVHALGRRFRLHQAGLPGTPDLTFPRLRKVIFVHGCFWHQHDDPTCWRSRLPKTRIDFWTAKLQSNVTRDVRQVQELETRGWQVLVVWECETTKSRRSE